MTARHPKKTSALFGILALFLALTPAAVALEPGEAWTISKGGKLYDNLWLVIGKPAPEGRNPDYPADIEALPVDTWRCVSCHGWDYSGADGHLGELGKSASFVSLRPASGRDPAAIQLSLLSSTHAKYVDNLGKSEISALAEFISVGQVNMRKLISNGRPIGHASAGKDIFEGACISCHQADGKAYIEGEQGDRPALGWVAQNRPAQALHKIINGVPSADMLSLRFLPEQSLSNLLAYLHSLDATTD